MPEPYCDCCDLPLDQCGKAAEQAVLAERRALEQRVLQRPGVVRAKIGGNCPLCRSRFSAGEPITKTEDGWTPVLCCMIDNE